ncbi:hypothetical protein [Leptospira alexanderi]|uniref:hypothetical protein n=1 Tax=Leptospira alexanderi TaxID=100053 RepID=UPI0009911C05|nr:hypothetical protein [Leptospira alexanderi]
MKNKIVQGVFSETICLLIVLYVFFTSCNQSDIVIIADSYQSGFLKNYLDNHNIFYKSQGGYFEIIENAKSLRVLQKLAKIQILRVEIDIQNINNVNSTRTAEGHYRKKYLSIDKYGSPTIDEDRKSEPFLKFDPAHPDSIQTGSKKGYVAFPNIVLSEELLNLESDIALYVLLRKERGHDRSIFVGVPTFWGFGTSS